MPLLALLALVLLMPSGGAAQALAWFARPAAPDEVVAQDTQDAQVEQHAAGAARAGAVADAGAIQPTEHPFLWRIEGDPPSYLYGTMHVGDPRLLALPDAVTEAFEQSDALYVEIPFDIATMSKVSAGSFLPLGTSLRDVLPEATLTRLRAFLEARGIPFAGVSQLQPWALSTVIPTLVEPPSPEAGAPLDLLLWGRAGELGLDRGSLETAEDQLGLFAGTGYDEQARMIERALDQVEQAAAEGRPIMEALLLDYLAGDEGELLGWADDEQSDDQEGSPQESDAQRRFTRNLVVDRNMFMLEGILDLLDEHPDKGFFFAVGALHQVGPYGLASMLAGEGFEVTRIGAPSSGP